MNWLGTRRARGDAEREISVAQASGAVRRRSGPPPDNAGWTIFSYLLSGMLVYGLLGWLLATLTHIGLLIPLGTLAGLLVAIGGIVYKYGRS
jgi:ATP synthase protein I